MSSGEFRGRKTGFLFSATLIRQISPLSPVQMIFASAIRSMLASDWRFREALRLAWPASIAASITPLLGTADVWALGRSERPLDIAAVGLAAVIFSLAYWTFGFIRMSVAGLTAQAAGAGDEEEMRAALMRGVVIGAAIGLALVILQRPAASLAFPLLRIGSEASDATIASARVYFDIRIWGAPFALATYAILGWLTARGRTDYLMAASLFITLANIALDWHFVLNLGYGAKGVAAGTLIAEIAGFLVAAGFAALIMMKEGGFALPDPRRLFDPARIGATLDVNRDIFIRTFILASAYAWFVQRSGAFGDVTLAANQTLLQLFLFTGLALDGAAIAAETLVGRAVGARNAAAYDIAFKTTMAIALAGAVLFTLLYAVLGGAAVALLTPEGAIRADALRYLPWVVISPLIVAYGFQLDGVFIGATRAREMRDAMIVTAIIFFPLSILFARTFGNHGLWAAFTVYFILRGATLAVYLPRIRRGISNAGSDRLAEA